ncbi:MAG: hypothetical protein IJS88_04475 [Alphaproteobacteria bacterium]|nr:hypothetical protein [Alphaproteobacteria bacterium]
MEEAEKNNIDNSSITNEGGNTIHECSDKCLRLYKMVWIISVVGLVVLIFLGIQNISMKKQIGMLKEQIGNMNSNFSYNVDDGRKIYVFDIDKAIEGIGLHETSRKFEEDIYELDRQVKEAQETIKDIKDEGMKNKVLTLSVKPLQMRRDELLDTYAKANQDALNKINNALAQIAAEDNIPTIFMNKSVAVNTNYVIDVTNKVVQIVKGSAAQ